MLVKEKTLDDLLNVVYKKLLKRPFDVKATRGMTSEVIGNLLILDNPLARISLSETRGKPFSALGELLWYLSKSNDLKFIEYYIPAYKKEADMGIDGKKIIYGGYGPRLFNWKEQNQFENIISLLSKKSTSRKAVIQLYDAVDIASNCKDIPCTCTLQFMARKGKLHMYTSMRSNDAYLGLPHDIFTFTMLQEILANDLGLRLGKYYHSVGSLHLYKKYQKHAEEYRNEGFQSLNKCMPKMPNGSAWNSIEQVLALERDIRKKDTINLSNLNVDNYWKDIIRLLQIHAFSKNNSRNLKAISDIRMDMESDVYNVYIEKKLGI